MNYEKSKCDLFGVTRCWSRHLIPLGTLFLLAACAAAPDPELSAENHIQLLEAGRPLATVYADSKECSSGFLLLRSDFDRASDVMCDAFNAELRRAASQLHFRLEVLSDAQFVRDEKRHLDVSPASRLPDNGEKYRVVVAHHAYLAQSNSGVPTASFGTTVYVYDRGTGRFLQKTEYTNEKITGYFAEMADVGRKTAVQLLADVFKK